MWSCLCLFSSTKKFQRIAALFLVIAGLIPISGCGGSTTGTGGITVNGRVLTESEAPLPDITVVLLETGGETISNANGDFAIISPIGGDLNLSFSGPGVSALTTLANVPDDAETVSAKFKVSSSGTSVDTSDVEIKKKKVKDPIKDDDDDDDDDSDDDDDDKSGKDKNKDKDKNKGKDDDKKGEDDDKEGNDDDGDDGDDGDDD